MLNWFRRLIDRRRERKAAVKKAQLALELKREHARAAARRRRERERAFTLEQARQVMSGTFVIADIETTGFSARHEILEIAAIRVAPAGEVLDEFSMLVRIQGTVPAQITALTGIRDEHVRHCGRPLAEALARFIAFCDRQPVFCHNAPFDARFLQAAARRVDLLFDNDVYCSLKVARAAWPQLRSHKLDALANYVDAPAPTHRGLDDVHTTKHVLFSAVGLPALAFAVYGHSLITQETCEHF